MVTLRGFRTARTGWFALLATGVVALHVTDTMFSVTRDGLDIVGCRDVLVERSRIEGGGDDVRPFLPLDIVLKSDWSLGRELLTKNVTIRDSTVGSWGNNCLQIGSETIGNFSDLVFERIACIYAGQAGIGISTMDGAHVHNARYTNITMKSTAIPISIYIGARQRRPPPRRVSSITNVTLRNITATDCFSDRPGPANWAATIDGQPADPRFNVSSPHPVGPGVAFHLIDLAKCSRGGGNSSLIKREPNHTAAEGYPELGFLAPRSAYGLFIRHATEMLLSAVRLGWWAGNATVNCCKPDARPAMVVEQAGGVVFSALRAKRDHSQHGSGYDVGLRAGAEGTVVKDSAGVVTRQI